MNSTKNSSENERRIIVGIDFGTTFSGIAWSESRRPDQQHVIEAWPSSTETHEGVSSVKVPTEIRYTSYGSEWGFQIPPTVPRWHWFKLDLGEVSSEKSKEKALEENSPYGQYRSPEDLTTDYLRELIKHLRYTLEQKLGSVIMKTIPLQFVLTVPAIWSDVARDTTLRAFRKAGGLSQFDTLLVSEPEAAAIYTLQALDSQQLEVGDTFVLCDAGGGTVDLISYSVTSTTPVIKLEEAAAGTGGLCGSTFLNSEFEKYLLSKLGKQLEDDLESLTDAMDRFNSVVKKQYSLSAGSVEGYSIPVPGLTNNKIKGISRGKINIKATDLKDVFEPTIQSIIDLVRGQIRATNKSIKAVLLVGGFGQNMYLKGRLREALAGSVEIIQPVNAWTAVVRGAVLMGLSPHHQQQGAVAVMRRRARKHYGTLFTVDYKEGVHDSERKAWSQKDQKYTVLELRWFVKRGDLVKEERPHQITGQWDLEVKKGRPRSITLAIKHDYKSALAPLHENENVKTLAKLEAQLEQLSEASLAGKIVTLKDGKEYYRINGAVEVTFYSASTKYTLLIDGERHDTVTAEYV